MDFYRRVELACNCIPKGKVATYGQIALLCGKPQNSRQVGYGLRTGKAGDVPAHRMVNARGMLSGAASFAVPGMQKMLLEAEGVQVLSLPEGCQIDLKLYGWRNTLEEAETLAGEFRRLGI